jgi:repressor LexA
VTAPTSTIAPLTKGQERVRSVIADFITHYGYPPTVREIAAGAGYHSPSSVAHQLRQLAKLHVLTWSPGRPRSIVLAASPEPEPTGTRCEHCGAVGRPA